jgi:ABC-type microcin C transport system duplicated ATPase subunit YejF
MDEPLSALDVTVQAQILNLLREIQASRGLSYLFISHDIVVAELCRRILVLQRGRIVEEASAADLLRRPQHAYTRSLVADTPRLPWQLTGEEQ